MQTKYHWTLCIAFGLKSAAYPGAFSGAKAATHLRHRAKTWTMRWAAAKGTLKGNNHWSIRLMN
jgi:hypothetical protein